MGRLVVSPVYGAETKHATVVHYFGATSWPCCIASVQTLQADVVKKAQLEALLKQNQLLEDQLEEEGKLRTTLEDTIKHVCFGCFGGFFLAYKNDMLC